MSRRAGHRSASFTQDRYGHHFPEADREVADRLDALILITSAEKVLTETDETQGGLKL